MISNGPTLSEEGPSAAFYWEKKVIEPSQNIMINQIHLEKGTGARG